MGTATNMRTIGERAHQIAAETGVSFSEAVGQVLQSIPERPRQQTEQTEPQTEQPQRKRR